MTQKENKYLLGYAVESSLRSYIEALEFSFKDHSIKLVFPNGEHTGIITLFIETSGVSYMEAHDETVELVNKFIDVLSFVTKSSTFLLYLSVALKSEAGNKNRIVFRQIAKDEIRGRYLQTPTRNSIQKILSSMENSNQIELPLRWLRYAYRARTFLEQFTYYWLAFERLLGEKQIQRLCAKCSEPIKECCKCKSPISTYPSIDKNDAKILLTKYDSSINKSLFDSIWRARQRVFHGGEVGNAFLSKLMEITPRIGHVVEATLKEKYSLLPRIEVGRPVSQYHREQINGFYSFKTKMENEEFALDYPTDDQFKNFHDSSDVISPDGFELVNFEQYQNW